MSHDWHARDHRTLGYRAFEVALFFAVEVPIVVGVLAAVATTAAERRGGAAQQYRSRHRAHRAQPRPKTMACRVDSRMTDLSKLPGVPTATRQASVLLVNRLATHRNLPDHDQVTSGVVETYAGCVCVGMSLRDGRWELWRRVSCLGDLRQEDLPWDALGYVRPMLERALVAALMTRIER